MVRAGRDDGAGHARGDPGDVRAVERVLPVQRRGGPAAPSPGPGKARATITFGVVHFLPPFGKPAGYEKPAGLKNGFVSSTPSSTTPILIPWPRPPVVAQNVSARITDGLWFVSRW